LCALFGFEFRYWRGIERVASLLTAPTDGYATVVDRQGCGPQMEAEFARSARYGEPLSVIVLERDLQRANPGVRDFVESLEQSGPGVIDHLSRAFARAQMCALISDHARRSDLIVAESDSRVIVLSSGTARSGGETFAERMLRASEAALGIPLVAGVAACPVDGANVDELVELARRRARPVDEVGTLLERRRDEAATEMTRLPLGSPQTVAEP
jgi:hypothetical protein